MKSVPKYSIEVENNATKILLNFHSFYYEIQSSKESGLTVELNADSSTENFRESIDFNFVRNRIHVCKHWISQTVSQKVIPYEKEFRFLKFNDALDVKYQGFARSLNLGVVLDEKVLDHRNHISRSIMIHKDARAEDFEIDPRIKKSPAELTPHQFRLSWSGIVNLLNACEKDLIRYQNGLTETKVITQRDRNLLTKKSKESNLFIQFNKDVRGVSAKVNGRVFYNPDAVSTFLDSLIIEKNSKYEPSFRIT